jgi:Flp pilus assembly protein TadB
MHCSSSVRPLAHSSSLRFRGSAHLCCADSLLASLAFAFAFAFARILILLALKLFCSYDGSFPSNYKIARNEMILYRGLTRFAMNTSHAFSKWQTNATPLNHGASHIARSFSLHRPHFHIALLFCALVFFVSVLFLSVLAFVFLLLLAPLRRFSLDLA